MTYADLPERYRNLGVAPGEIEILAPLSAPLPVVFENKYIALLNDRVRFPGGKEGNYLRLFSQGALRGSAGAVALARNNGVYILLNVFRHPVRSWQLECPRGFSEPNENPADTIRREVREELGVNVVTALPLGDVCPDSGIQASHVAMFLVDVDALPANAAEEASSEAIAGYRFFDREQLMSSIASGAIHDGFTLSVIAVASAKGLL